MTVAYVETIGGASGNMLLGALIDAGADVERLIAALETLPIQGWTFERRRVDKRGIAADYVDFAIPGEDGRPGARVQSGRHLRDVLAILERSGLSVAQKARAARVYRRLAEAEARVHGTSVERIHFHEVGAVDAILDVAGVVVALDLLAVEALYCSALPHGRGSISMVHGRYPNPPPATAELLRGAPTYDGGIEGEMVTTTGAALLTTLVERPGERPAMRSERLGYGAGRADFAIPNVLRISVGPLVPAAAMTGSGDAAGGDFVCVLEANVDDMSPQRFELALERALAAGAYDVWLAPVTMKKSRPGILFGALAPLGCEAAVARAVLAETTTLGVRVRHERRYVLPRTIATVETPLGAVRVKTAELGDGERRRTLEYDDVAAIARALERPFAEVAARLEAYLPPA